MAEAAPATAQRAAEADKLNAEVNRLYNAGKYAETVTLAQRAHTLYKKALRPDPPDIASPEPLYRRVWQQSSHEHRI